MLARGLCFALVLIQAVTLGLMTRHWGMPLALVGAAAIGVWGRLAVNPSRDQRVMIGLALTLPFLAWYFFYLEVQKIETTLLRSNTGVLMAHYFLALQVLQLFFRHDTVMPVLLPLGGVLVLTFAGDVSIFSQVERKTAYFALALAFAGLSAAYFSVTHPRIPGATRRGRRMRLVWLCATLLAAAGLAWSTARAIERVKEPVDQWAGNYILRAPELTLGNTTVARIGAIPKFKREQGNRIALRIESERPPDYLRTRILEEYDSAEWHFHGEQRRVNPKPERPPGLPADPSGAYFPIVEPEAAGPYETFDVHPDVKIRTAMHTPHGTAWIATEASQIMVDAFAAPEATRDLYGTRYAVHVQQPLPPVSLSDAERALFTQLPETLNPRILELARDVCSGKVSELEKIAAIVQYFTQRYRYDLGIAIPINQDPIEYFLFEEPPGAHCEFFATGAALLLRAVGIPCRYVIGVVAWERSPLGGYWIVRNRDAHAWVEAFVSRDGTPAGPGQWLIVEATPAEGLPEADDRGRGTPLADLVGALRFRIGQLVALIRNGEWGAAFRAALLLLALPVRWLLLTWMGWLTLALLAWPAWKYIIARRWSVRRRNSRPANPRHVEMARLLRKADLQLKRQGLVRPPGETLHTFAARVEEEAPEALRGFAAWYRAYAQCRYGAPISSETFARLRRTWPSPPAGT